MAFELVSPAFAAYESTLLEMAKSAKLAARHVLEVRNGIAIYDEQSIICEQRVKYPSLVVFRRRLNHDLYLWKEVYYQFVYEFERDDVRENIHSDDDTASTYDMLE